MLPLRHQLGDNRQLFLVFAIGNYRCHRGVGVILRGLSYETEKHLTMVESCRYRKHQEVLSPKGKPAIVGQ